MENERVIVHVNTSIWTEHVWIMIPPRLWGHVNLAEGIKRAVETTFQRAEQTGFDCKECTSDQSIEFLKLGMEVE